MRGPATIQELIAWILSMPGMEMVRSVRKIK